jgi:ribosome-associated protein
MLQINSRLAISETELQWTFVRAGGPGGQNVNKVASKAVLRWNLEESPSIPTEVKELIRRQQRKRITNTGELILNSQRFRDQDKNKGDCLLKLRELILRAASPPRPRRPTKPTRGSRERRLQAKQQRSNIKSQRRQKMED